MKHSKMTNENFLKYLREYFLLKILLHYLCSFKKFSFFILRCFMCCSHKEHYKNISKWRQNLIMKKEVKWQNRRQNALSQAGEWQQNTFVASFVAKKSKKDTVRVTEREKVNFELWKGFSDKAFVAYFVAKAFSILKFEMVKT